MMENQALPERFVFVQNEDFGSRIYERKNGKNIVLDSTFYFYYEQAQERGRKIAKANKLPFID